MAEQYDDHVKRWRAHWWFSALDDDDLGGHLFRAGCAFAPPEKRALSNRALGKLYRDAITRGVSPDPMLKDWFTRTSYAIMCGEGDPVMVVNRLFGSKIPRGHPRVDTGHDLQIAVRIVHLIYGGFGITQAVEKVKAETKPVLSIQKVWKIWSKHQVEAKEEFNAWMKTLITSENTFDISK